MFLRKNKVNDVSTYVYNNQVYNYTIVYKNIKHIYFRMKNQVIEITANKKLNKEQVLHALSLKIGQIVKIKDNKKVRIKSEKYQLWGKPILKEDFFGPLAETDSNMFEIYKKETMLKIKEMIPDLIIDIEKIGLKTVPIIVKPLKSKYGSCHIIKIEITINSFLAKLDPIYLYYVLLHEYAHLNVANHQAEFYKELDKMMKNHKIIQKNLRKHTIMF